MFTFSKAAVAGLALGLALFLTGCANTPAQSTLMPSEKGVMCSKCKTTWIKVPETNGKGRIIALTDQQSHMCPDCMDAVTSFFNTGKLEHTCKTCGADTLSVCNAHMQ